jgi:hypothetical protein
MVEEISFAISVIHPVYRNFAVGQGPDRSNFC